MLRSQNFEKVMTSELLIKQQTESEQKICREELDRRLKSIGFTDKQIDTFVTNEQAIIDSRKSDKSANEKFMAQTEFFNSFHLRNIKVEELTISEMLMATEQATNKYPCAMSGEGEYRYFELVSEYARQMFAKGYNTAIKRLKEIGLEDNSIKKFIFAEWQVIRKVTFDDQEAIDAWGNPKEFLS